MNALQKYQIPNDELAAYEIPAASEEAVRKLFYDWYVLMNFQSLADDYGTCMTLASVNSFFILVKVLKYFGKLSPFMPLFRYVIGDFDTDELSRASPTLFIPIFIVFM